MSGRIWVGLFFLIFGVGFFLHQAELINFIQVLSTWWPCILIIIGLIQIVNRTHSSVVSGILFMLVGGIFLLNQWFDLNLITYIWPLIFIFIGIIIIFSRMKHEKTLHTSEELNNLVLFSGAEIKNQSRNFQGGSVMAILGGVEIDLRDAVIMDGASIDITTILGGVSILVPENVHVELSGIPIMGGWEDSTRNYGAGDDVVVLKLNCLTVLGGAEIKN